jgi:NADPH-dependent curcumin reductase CurA
MDAQAVNRQWRLIERPAGKVGEEHFGYREEPVPTPGDGEVLVRTLYLSFDPAMRAFLNDGPGYAPPQQVGAVMRAGAIAQVVESRAEGLRPGDVVFGAFGWQDYAASAAQGLLKIPPGRPLTDHMSVLGGTGLTAYFGLIEIGQPKAGDTIVVSGAAGATGSTVVQIARILGCRAIAIAGGPEKRRWTIDALGADAAIDYKSENVGQRLAELCPDGVDVYFDNVGGSTLEAAIGKMKRHGRIVLCGMIAGYNAAAPGPGPRNLFQLVARSVRMEGFLLYDFAPGLAEGRRTLEEWMDAGRLKAFVDVQEGFENIPKTFLRLFSGANVGKQTLKVADPVLTVPPA